MHKNIIEFFKTFFKKNNTENINIDEMIKEEYCVTKEEVLNEGINNEGSEEPLIQLLQNLTVTPKQLRVLEKLANGSAVQLNLKKRATIILEVLEESNHSHVSERLGITRKTVIKWTKRWKESQPELERVERDEPRKLNKTINEILGDKYRAGRPSDFTMNQIACIINLSLQKPESVGLPITHWTAGALAWKAAEDNIIEKISPRQISRYLKEIDLKVHQYKGWLNSKDKLKDPEEFEKRVTTVCEIYLNSKSLQEDGVHVVSCDEKTGIQALEHKHPSKPAKPGEIEKCEQEYKRNGTTTLIASRDINTGEIIAPMVQATRTEEDFLNHISAVVALAPEDKYIFVMDQLNTHKSESLVKYVAEHCGIKEDLGKKGSEGILHTMKTREAFLEDESHQIRIVYTPKHSSWMNQIEIWFGILSAKVLGGRSSFKSVQELEEKILNFIVYYNKNLAKPFKWNYAGKLLKA
jgi:transposase